MSSESELTGPGPVASKSPDQPKSQLRRGLSVWQAVGISVALMAPSMAININPQGTSALVGRATPLAFLLAAIAVLLIAYVFVRLCQYYRHAGSVYIFAGATLGSRAGAIAGLGLFATYVFYGMVTISATGIFGTEFLKVVGIWPNPPWWAGFVIAAVALIGAFVLATTPAKKAGSLLLTIEGFTVTLIVIVAAVALIRMLVGNAPDNAHFTMTVFSVPKGTDTSSLFLGIVFGLLSFAGFEAAATLGEEAHNPRRDIPRAILGTAIFGGIYFTVITAIEMMVFSTGTQGVDGFTKSPALMGYIGQTYIGSWVADIVTLGAAISAFGCALACVVGAARLIFAITRDLSPNSPLAQTNRIGSPAAASGLVAGVIGIIGVIMLVLSHDQFNSFAWSGTIGTLILIVAYVLATIGCIKLVFIDRKMTVPSWQIVIPILTLIVLGYTLYRNVIPWPEGAAQWLPIVAFGWLILVTIVVFAVPSLAKRLTRGLAAADHSAIIDNDSGPMTDEGFMSEKRY
ncbi:MAG: APC family permease [Antricoccus sp.]